MTAVSLPVLSARTVRELHPPCGNQTHHRDVRAHWAVTVECPRCQSRYTWLTCGRHHRLVMRLLGEVPWQHTECGFKHGRPTLVSVVTL